jgi:small subunit ribosomal protein S9
MSSGYDFHVSVIGGGVTGQSGAIKLGLARALVEIDPTQRSAFRKEGFLTRDPRMVERKKPGQPKARRRFQHSKR